MCAVGDEDEERLGWMGCTWSMHGTASCLPARRATGWVYCDLRLAALPPVHCTPPAPLPCEQTLEHPSNLWAVAFLPGSGDLVTACSDGVARLWTQAEGRHASAEAAQVLLLPLLLPLLLRSVC